MAITGLAELGAETWGERLGRARSRANVNLRDAAARISTVTPVSHMALARLEKLSVPPQDDRRRFVAFVALLAYGFDPQEFGLSIDDIPRRVTPAMLEAVLPPDDSGPESGTHRGFDGKGCIPRTAEYGATQAPAPSSAVAPAGHAA